FDKVPRSVNSLPLLTGYKTILGDNSTTSSFTWILVLGLVSSFHSFVFGMGKKATSPTQRQSRGAELAPSVAFLRPHYPESSVQDAVFSPLDDARIFIKPEPLHNFDMDVVTEHSFLASVPTVTNEREERLRCRQRGYEKRFRGCKTKSLNMQAHPRNEAGRLAEEAL
ncbi:hypothetical protein PR003_g19465, partial [Phytophthora rubi]